MCQAFSCHVLFHSFVHYAAALLILLSPYLRIFKRG